MTKTLMKVKIVNRGPLKNGNGTYTNLPLYDSDIILYVMIFTWPYDYAQCAGLACITFERSG